MSGGFLQWLEDMDGKQPGDPDKATAAMIQVVESDAPPLRLALGADAVGTIEEKLKINASRTRCLERSFGEHSI